MELRTYGSPSTLGAYHPIVIQAWEHAPRHLDPKFKASEEDEPASYEIVEVADLDED